MTRYTSFHGHRIVASGDLPANAQAVRRALAEPVARPEPVLTFDDRTGSQVDIDPRLPYDVAVPDARIDHAGALETAAQHAAAAPGATSASPAAPADAPRGRGRPKLGVVAREVTLLPRHWEWLEAQPGGASVTLRKLVEEARRQHAERDVRRAAQERAYRVLNALAGNLPGFEEATRALFAGDAAAFARSAAHWPRDVLAYATRLAFDWDDLRGDLP